MIKALLIFIEPSVKLVRNISLLLVLISGWYAVYKVYYEIPVEQGMYPIYIENEPTKHVATADFYNAGEAVVRFIADDTSVRCKCEMQVKQKPGQTFIEILSYENKAKKFLWQSRLKSGCCYDNMDRLGPYLVVNSGDRLITRDKHWKLPERRTLQSEIAFWLSIGFLSLAVLFHWFYLRNQSREDLNNENEASKVKPDFIAEMNIAEQQTDENTNAVPSAEKDKEDGKKISRRIKLRHTWTAVLVLMLGFSTWLAISMEQHLRSELLKDGINPSNDWLYVNSVRLWSAVAAFFLIAVVARLARNKQVKNKWGKRKG